MIITTANPVISQPVQYDMVQVIHQPLELDVIDNNYSIIFVKTK